MVSNMSSASVRIGFIHLGDRLGDEPQALVGKDEDVAGGHARDLRADCRDGSNPFALRSRPASEFGLEAADGHCLASRPGWSPRPACWSSAGSAALAAPRCSRPSSALHRRAGAARAPAPRRGAAGAGATRREARMAELARLQAETTGRVQAMGEMLAGRQSRSRARAHERLDAVTHRLGQSMQHTTPADHRQSAEARTSGSR